MEPAALELVRSLGNQWLSIAFVIAWVIYKTGVVQAWFGTQASERAQLSGDQQRLVENLSAALTRLEARIDKEREHGEEQLAAAHEERDVRLAQLRAECNRETEKLRDEVAALIRGEARWRHLTGNLGQYVAALQAALRRHGIDVPRFGGWDQFIAEGGDPMMAIGDE